MNESVSEPRRPPGGVVELLAVALPMMASHACETVMMFTDRLFLGRVGPEYMSAAMGGGLTCFMFMTFFMGLTSYANALVAQHLGAGQKEKCGAAAAQALLIAAAAYPLLLLSIPLGEQLFRFIGVAEAQMGPQCDYFNILMLGSILALTRNSFASFFSGIGRTRVVMLSAAVSMVVNISLNYVLIFGHFGFPRLEMRGAAIGTLLGSAAGLVVIGACYFRASNRREFGTASGLRFDRELMSKLLRFGSPSGLEMFLNLLAFDLLVLNFHSYGVAVAAATTVAFNWDLVSFIPLLGVGIGVTSLVGRYMGRHDPDTAHRSTLSGLTVACAYGCVTFTAFLGFPETLVSVFAPADSGAVFQEAAPLAVFMVRLVSVYVFADACIVVLSGALRGAGDTFWTMVLSVSGHWAFTLTGAVLIRGVGVTPRTAWVAVVIMIVGLCLLFVWRYRSGQWRKIRVVTTPSPPPPVADEMEMH